MISISLFWISMLSTLMWVLCFSLWHFLGSDLYYIGQAQVILVLLIYVHKQANTRPQRFVSRLFVFIGFNNFLDEIFFDPSKFELNEYVIFGVFLIYSIWTYKKR